MSNANVRKTPAAAPDQVDASSLIALEKRYVFDAAGAAELHHLVDSHGMSVGDGHPHASPAHALQAAVHALATGPSDAGHALETFKSLAGAHVHSAHFASDSAHNQVAFIDASLPDVSTIIKDLPSGMRVVLIDNKSDAIGQMQTYLDAHKGLKAVHIIAGGTEANLDIGTSVLNATTVSGLYKGALAQIGADLAPGGDILIYGCNFAKGSDGLAVEQLIAAATGAKVAAADHVVGAASLGGSWVLDKAIGSIDVASISAADWSHDLLKIAAGDGFVTGSSFAPITGAITSSQAFTDTGVVPVFNLVDPADPTNTAIPNATTFTTANGGKVVMNSDGTFAYTAKAGFSGTDKLSYMASAVDVGGQKQYAIAFETITVLKPQIVAQADSKSTAYLTAVNGSIVGDVNANVAGAALVYKLVSALPDPTTVGTLVFDAASGTFSFTPAKGFAGPYTFSWSASYAADGTIASTANYTINVAPPLSTVSGYTTAVTADISTTQTIGLSSLYTETVSGAKVTFSVDPNSLPLGNVTFNANGTISYTPSAGLVAAAGGATGPTDSFNIIATDSNGFSTKIPISILVTASGHGVPVANGDSYSLINGAGALTATPSVSEITHNNGGTVSFPNLQFDAPQFSSGMSGSFVDNQNGTFTYTPTDGPAGLGTVKVGYTYTDQFGQTAHGVETISVAAPPLSTAGVVKYASIGSPVTLDLNAQSNIAHGDPWIGPASDANAGHLTFTITQQPLHGTLAFDPKTGGATYTPGVDTKGVTWSGVDSFNYTVSDGYNTVSATDTIVSPSQIFAASDLHILPQGTPSYSGTVSTISGSPAGGLVWAQMASPVPKYGTVSFHSDGTYTYTPTNASTPGFDEFAYKLTDSTGHVATAYVDILIPTAHQAGDVPPTPNGAISDQLNHDNLPVAGVDVSGYFNVTTGTPTYYASGLPAGLTIDPASGIIKGTVGQNDSQAIPAGNYTVNVVVDDGMGGVTKQTFTWTIVNDPPVAKPHGETTAYLTPVPGDVSIGDTDPNSDPLTFSVATNPAHGTVSLNSATGKYTYTPAAGFSGIDTFTYTASDGKGGTATATETIQVGPKATPHSYATLDNTSVNGNVASSDTYQAGATFTADAKTAQGVSISVDATTGKYTYTPPLNFVGTDTFNYTVTDPVTNLTSSSTETIVVGPTGTPHTLLTPFSTPVNGDVTVGDTYLANSQFTVVTGKGPANGSVTLDPNTGKYTYTPTTANFTGTDTFTYLITEPDGNTVTAVETIDVGPKAVGHTFSTPYQTKLNFVKGSVTDASVNDYFAANSTFTAPATTTKGGSVSMNSDGTYTYTPKAGFTGTDTFIYTVTDPNGNAATATETILVGPNAKSHTWLTPFNTALVGKAGVSGDASFKDTYEPGSVFSEASATTKGGQVLDKNGNPGINPDGTYTYIPPLNFVGTDTFTYTVIDPITNMSSTATETIDVAPKAVGHTFKTPYQTTLNPVVGSTADASVSDLYPSGSKFTAPTTSVNGGTISMNANGTYSYTPKAGFTGPDTFVYTVTDPNGNASTATETILVGPNATPHTSLTPFNTALVGKAGAAGDASVKDTYEPGSTFSAPTTSANGGTVSMNASGIYTYTPPLNFVGTDTFTYTVTDPITNMSSTATETIDVAPKAVGHTFKTPYQTTLNPVVGSTADASVSDLYPSGSKFTAPSTSVNGGTISMNSNGTYSYTPKAGFTGPDTFVYTVTDPNGNASTATETILVGPNATPHTSLTPFNTALVGKAGAAGDASVKDTYEPGSTFAAPTTSANGGTVSMNASGIYTYTPPLNFVGTDTFTYTVTDPITNMSSTATETIDVAPKAVGHTFKTPYETALNFVKGGVADASVNDLVASGSKFSAPTTTGAGAIVTMNADGTYKYTPAAHFTGIDTFTYTVTDALGNTSTATETIMVGPSATPHSTTTPFNTPLIGGAGGAGDASVADVYEPGSTFAPVSTTTAKGGTVVMNANGTYSYTPATNTLGPDTFQYTVTDPKTGMTATATETITVLPPPISAQDHFYTIPAGTMLTGDAKPGDTYYHTDATFASITDSKFSGPSVSAKGGTVIMKADGTYTYTPPSLGFLGTDTFTYKITDPAGQTITAVEHITVVAPNIAAVDHSYSTPFNTSISGNAATGDTYETASVFTEVSPTSKGGAVVDKNGKPGLNPDGTYTYIPPKNFVGTDTFTYQVKDPTGASVTKTETIVVKPPTIAAIAHKYTGNYNTPVNGSAAPGDTYYTGSIFTVKSNPAHGSVTMNPNGTFTYYPTAGFTGTDTFIYQIKDPAGQIVTNTETITIGPAPAYLKCLTSFSKLKR